MTATTTTQTTVTTYAVETINRADGSVDGHRAGCADIARIAKREHADRSGAFDVATKHDAWLDYNADFLPESGSAYDINWLPCAKAVPQGEADDAAAWTAEQEPEVDFDSEQDAEEPEEDAQPTMTKAEAWKRLRNLRESVRLLAGALDANDWDTFDEAYGMVTGDADMVNQYREQF